MAFIDSTSSQRVELLRQAEKTANLTRRVTVGSGVLGAPEGADGGELCTALSAALSDIGYGGLPPGGAMVNGGDPAPVLKLGGVTLITGSTLVEDNVFEGIELAQTDTTISHGGTVVVQNSAGAAATNATATVTANTLNYVRLPATSAIVANNGTTAVQNSGGTAVGSAATLVVASGALTAIKLPTSTAPTTSTTTPAILNSTGTVAGGNGTVTVTNGAIANIKLPAGTALVPNAYALTGVAPTGTYTSTVTFTVAGGLITGITLS